MGYTNYWNQFRDFTDEEWVKIKNQVEYVGAVMDNVAIVYGVDFISFNGMGEESHEDFVLSKKQNLSPNDHRPYKFNFCKTAEKPYDIGVWYLLTWIYNHPDNASAICRDRVGETSMEEETYTGERRQLA